MEQAIPATLFGAAKTYWRSFVPIWVFPIVFLYGGVASDKMGHPLMFFWLVAMPYFFWCFSRAARIWLAQQIKYSHFAFLVFLFPFMIWTAAVFSRLIVIAVIANV